MKKVLLLSSVFSVLAAAVGAMTYTVDRTIESGSVTGFIETDGTIGQLAADNIKDWSITLASPDLFGGSPQINTAATGSTFVLGSGLTATVTEITFDFEIAGAGFAILGAFSAWCMSATQEECIEGADPIDVSEGIYFDTALTGAAELEERSGLVTLATVSSVPLPASLPLMALALGGIACLVHRRNKAA